MEQYRIDFKLTYELEHTIRNTVNSYMILYAKDSIDAEKQFKNQLYKKTKEQQATILHIAYDTPYLVNWESITGSRTYYSEF